jgi:hypothetical protein
MQVPADTVSASAVLMLGQQVPQCCSPPHHTALPASPSMQWHVGFQEPYETSRHTYACGLPAVQSWDTEADIPGIPAATRLTITVSGWLISSVVVTVQCPFSDIPDWARCLFAAASCAIAYLQQTDATMLNLSSSAYRVVHCCCMVDQSHMGGMGCDG